LDRCGNPKFPAYLNVRVCERWSDKETGFQSFLADLGERPPSATLGRFMDIGDYENSNVSWMSKAEQLAEQKKKRQFMRGVLTQFSRQGRNANKSSNPDR
jgi:hypothetical protein